MPGGHAAPPPTAGGPSTRTASGAPVPAGRGGWSRAEPVLAVLVAGVVGMMIVPLPTAVLDILIASNLALSVLLLLSALHVRQRLSLSALPTLLLLSTLYRLALNVSSTRLILLQADAGRVIDAFGHFVVRGDYIVGAVVFVILTLIQFVVVARGAERVAEVGARFSLDALPGQQLAIDADLRAGAIDLQTAGDRRRELQRESQFYGAMDGAMKFVRGDAIAGLSITLINLIAGVAVGSGTRGLPVAQSLQVYGLLTIGDGLVSQLPALLTATAAGIVVTRVTPAPEHDTLGHELRRQLLGDRRVLGAAAVLLALLSLLPGLPAVPFLVLALATALGSRWAGHADGTDAAPRGAPTPEVTPLGIDVPETQYAALERPLQDAYAALQAEFFDRLGLPLPPLQVRTRKAMDFQVWVHELPAGAGPVPADGSPPTRVQPLVDALRAAVRAQPESFIDLQSTRELLLRLQGTAPARVEPWTSGHVGLRDLTTVLRALLQEQVSIRPLGDILDTLYACGPECDPETRLQRVRRRLSAHICHAATGPAGLHVHPLDGPLEDAVRDGIARGPQGAYLALDPELATEIGAAVARTIDPATAPAVVVTQADTRRFVFELLHPQLPQVHVLSYPELPPALPVTQGAVVRLGRAAAVD